MVMNCYESHEIVSMVNKEALPTDFFLNYAFPVENTMVTDADKVVLNRYTEAKACMAPYTDPCGPGCALKRPETAADLSEIAPPTIKLNDTVTVCDVEERRIDPKTGMFVRNHADRMAAEVAEKSANMRNAIIERLRFDAAQLLHNGAYTIEGDKVKTTLLDFKRDERLTLDLVADGGDTWDQPMTDPQELFEAITEVMLCYGVSGQFDVIFSPTAWKWYKLHEELDRRDFNYSNGNSREISADMNVMPYGDVQPKGSDGSFRYWLVNQKYKDISVDGEGNEVVQMLDMIPDGSILIVQREAFMGRRIFGGIKRVDGSTMMQSIWYRDMIDDECEVRKLQAWSRPLLVPGNVNASACIQVVDPDLDLADLCPVCE